PVPESYSERMSSCPGLARASTRTAMAMPASRGWPDQVRPRTMKIRVSQRLGAGDDLDQLLGDDGLAGAVVVHREPVDHLAGIARRAVHRGHPGALLARGVFEERGIDLHRQIVRQELGQDFLFRRLEFINR